MSIMPSIKLKVGVCLLTLFLCLRLVPVGYALGSPDTKNPGDGRAPSANASWERGSYLIEGIYYLISKGDRDTAEELFKRAILSSSFNGLSLGSRTGDQQEFNGIDRWFVAESFYFLGKIHYEKAVLSDRGMRGEDLQEDIAQNIALAKQYMRRAEDYGIVYDRLHPPLLDEINRKYPAMDGVVTESRGDKARVTIEMDRGSYQMDSLKINQDADITQSRFSTNREFGLECGARYKMKPNTQRGYKAIYRTLAVVGIGLVVWLTRG